MTTDIRFQEYLSAIAGESSVPNDPRTKNELYLGKIANRLNGMSGIIHRHLILWKDSGNLELWFDLFTDSDSAFTKESLLSYLYTLGEEILVHGFVKDSGSLYPVLSIDSISNTTAEIRAYSDSQILLPIVISTSTAGTVSDVVISL